VCGVVGDAIQNVLRRGQGRDAGEGALSASVEYASSKKKLIGNGHDVTKKHVHVSVVERKSRLHWRRLSHYGGPLCAPSDVYFGTIW
jgi:hypothetical protein